ncbi:response regulator [Parvularcula dongshanensis]|uniref:DNA-binding NarL/FixJ family response regulator n=1 Tax=Parvularcula dongshanensis TaxID=1173995 RepID=A0A840HY87_9PROT|nr:response regulator [Parvularcula dongshanensis]MBB4657816.1 DNA-binding NarL/FixJ family response regulator [Parvularcula dongshanensis]
MSEAKTVVIVEDEFLIANYLDGLCKQMSVEVLGLAAKADEALSLISETKPQYILMDVRLQGRRDGVDVSNAVHAERPETRIVFITGSNEPPTLDRINTDDPFRVLIKPINPSELREAFGLD